jgi:hypothetical protein
MSIAGPIAAFRASPPTRFSFSLARQARLIIARVSDAIAHSNEKRANREVANFLARNGGMFTDEMERRIGERFSRG